MSERPVPMDFPLQGTERFRLLIIKGDDVQVMPFTTLQAAVTEYRWQAIEIQRDLEFRRPPWPEEHTEKMRQAISLTLFAPNWVKLFDRSVHT